MKELRTPSADNSPTALSDFSRLRAAMTTAAPAAASPFAMPSPMPPLPPVTIATRPDRSNRLIGISCAAEASSILRQCRLERQLPQNERARRRAGLLRASGHEAQ